MAIGHYHRQSPGTFIVKHLKSSWFGHIYHHDTLPKNPITGNSRQQSSQKKTMKRPVIVFVAVHYRRQKLMSNHCSGGICRSTPQRRLGVTGVSQSVYFECIMGNFGKLKKTDQRLIDGLNWCHYIACCTALHKCYVIYSF